MSKIYGNINANKGIGNIIISNPNGVLFDGSKFTTAGDVTISTQNMSKVTLEDLNNNNFTNAAFTKVHDKFGNPIGIEMKNGATFEVAGKYNIITPDLKLTIDGDQKLVTHNGQDYLEFHGNHCCNCGTHAVDDNGKIIIVDMNNDNFFHNNHHHDGHLSHNGHNNYNNGHNHGGYNRPHKEEGVIYKPPYFDKSNFEQNNHHDHNNHDWNNDNHGHSNHGHGQNPNWNNNPGNNGDPNFNNGGNTVSHDKLSQKYYLRALQKYMIGDLEGSKADLSSISNNIENADAYYYRAAINKQLGDMNGFNNDYAKAVSLNPYYINSKFSNSVAFAH